MLLLWNQKTVKWWALFTEFGKRKVCHLNHYVFFVHFLPSKQWCTWLIELFEGDILLGDLTKGKCTHLNTFHIARKAPKAIMFLEEFKAPSFSTDSLEIVSFISVSFLEIVTLWAQALPSSQWCSRSEITAIQITVFSNY